MKETRVQSLGQDDPLEKGMANPLQYSCLENSMDRGAWWVTGKKSDTTEQLTLSFSHTVYVCVCIYIYIYTWTHSFYVNLNSRSTAV